MENDTMKYDQNEFAKSIYEGIVVDNLGEYQSTFNSNVEDSYIDYWKNAINLFSSLDEEEKRVFFSILKTTIIDTISNVFGVLDGSVALQASNFDFNVKINNEDVTGELQDAFLAYIEDNNGYDL